MLAGIEPTPADQKKTKLKEHLSTAFVAMGIISFALTIIINYNTVQRLRAK